MRVVSIGSLLVLALISRGAADPLINYQGLLTDALGAPIDGSVDLVFTLYDDELTGDAVWSENHPNHPVAAGEFNVLLGSVTPLDPSLFDAPELWLGFEVDGETLTPRQRVTSVPFAVRAACSPGDRLGCYAGEESTLGVGECRAGARRCGAGGQWGECVGEVVPTIELCGNGLDDDCDGAADVGCGAPDGAPCGVGSECLSLHCQNGYCCASGDCCASAADCTAYGEPSSCVAVPSCQGTRLDGVCTGASQCAASAPIADDSGCAGQVADACGLYPSVFCTSAPTQSPPACATSCIDDLGCDAAAHCSTGICVPD